MNVWVGTENPVKVAATREAFLRHHPAVTVKGVRVDSGVSPQPVGEETLKGALNRVRALKSLPGAEEVDFFVGIEGGIGRIWGCWFAFGVAVIEDARGRRGIGFSPLFLLPRAWIPRLLSGEELGPLVDEATGRSMTKHDLGAIGYLTRGDMDRKELYVHGLRAALVPFFHEGTEFSCPGL